MLHAVRSQVTAREDRILNNNSATKKPLLRKDLRPEIPETKNPPKSQPRKRRLRGPRDGRRTRDDADRGRSRAVSPVFRGMRTLQPSEMPCESHTIETPFGGNFSHMLRLVLMLGHACKVWITIFCACSWRPSLVVTHSRHPHLSLACAHSPPPKTLKSVSTLRTLCLVHLCVHRPACRFF